MKKLLCILAILALFVPAIALAQNEEAMTTEPSIPVTLPDNVLYIIGDATDHLALAIASHNSDEINSTLAIAEERLAQAIAMADEGNLKAIVNANPEEQTAMAKVMVDTDCTGKLKADVKIRPNDEGVYRIDIKINGDLTEQQKAYITALVGKVQYQVPGIPITIKYL